MCVCVCVCVCVFCNVSHCYKVMQVRLQQSDNRRGGREGEERCSRQTGEAYFDGPILQLRAMK